MVEEKNFISRLFSAFLMFIIGFVGFSILGALVLTILISLGIVPSL